MATIQTETKLDKAFDMLIDVLVTKDEAAEMFGIKRRFFNRLLERNAFGLKGAEIGVYDYLKDGLFYREDIERIALVYRSQAKKIRRVSD